MSRLREASMATAKDLLIVEDDPLIIEFSRGMFEDAGFAVIAFNTADHALVHLWEVSGNVLAVFTDVRMPGFSNGFHLAELIKRHWPEIKVLVTSGQEPPPLSLQKDIHFFSKPWRIDDIIAVLNDKPGYSVPCSTLCCLMPTGAEVTA